MLCDEHMEVAQRIGALCRGLVEKDQGFGGVFVGESFTGGGIMDSLISIPGASQYVLGGVVFYNLMLKEALGLAGIEPVSAEFAEKSAQELLAYAKREYGVFPSITVTSTGFAGPSGQVGLFYIGIATKDKAKSFRFEISPEGDHITKRNAIRAQGVHEALNLIEEWLRESF